MINTHRCDAYQFNNISREKKLFIIWRKRTTTKTFLQNSSSILVSKIVWISITLAKMNSKEQQKHNKANPFFMLFSSIKIYYHHQIPIHIVHSAHSSTNVLVWLRLKYGFCCFVQRLHREYLHNMARWFQCSFAEYLASISLVASHTHWATSQFDWYCIPSKMASRWIVVFTAKINT